MSTSLQRLVSVKRVIAIWAKCPEDDVSLESSLSDLSAQPSETLITRLNNRMRRYQDLKEELTPQMWSDNPPSFVADVYALVESKCFGVLA